MIATVFSLTIMSMAKSNLLILVVKRPHPEASIQTGENALPWVIATLFGLELAYFGDHYPVTLGGRLIALHLVLVSLGMKGSVAGVMSTSIEQEPESCRQDDDRGAEPVAHGRR